jgi:pectate lyase
MLFQCQHTPPPQEAFDSHRDYSESLLVFPGAEGFGIDTPAGRGGQILIVSNLNDTGAGSMREALEAEGPRTVLFAVSGVIELSREISIKSPYLTVAGQTAPAPGITLINAGVSIQTHDVLIQHIHIRPGDASSRDRPEDRDGISVISNEEGLLDIYNVVIDHCSISWAIDEGMSTWYPNVADITFSNCLIAENLSESLHPKGEHSKGLLIGDHARRIAVIHNVFAHNMRRNPLIKGDVSALIYGNVIYNPGTQAIGFGDRERSGFSRASVQSNLLIPGPSSSEDLKLISGERETSSGIQLFLEENYVLGDELVKYELEVNYDVLVNIPPVSVKPLEVVEIDSLLESQLETVGAFPKKRDYVDQRIIESIRNRNGSIIDSQEDVGGYPNDSRSVHNLEIPENPNADEDNDGYTNLEEWLHNLAEEKLY